MERWKEFGWKLLYPGKVLSVLIPIVGFGLLIGLSYYGLTDHPVIYASYVLAFYALVVVVANCIPLVRKGIGAYGKVKETGIFHISRTMMVSVAINVIYSGYHLISGILYHSVWLISNGIYYLILSLIRLMLVRYEKKQAVLDDQKEQQVLGWKGFSLCGSLMFLLNIAMSGMVIQMIRDGQGSSYPEIMVYTVATYTFYRLTTAIIRVVRSEKNGNPIHGAARNISLTASMMSLYSLQITMLNVFGDGTTDALLLNSLSGAAVCILVILGALGMILHGIRRRKELCV